LSPARGEKTGRRPRMLKVPWTRRKGPTATSRALATVRAMSARSTAERRRSRPRAGSLPGSGWMAEMTAAGAICRLRTLRGREGRLRIWWQMRSNRAMVRAGTRLEMLR
jgi:hypothetical protein